MKKYNLQLNDVQASMLQRMLKEEIQNQRKWKIDEEREFNKKDNHRDYLSANMWQLIEQLCAQGVEAHWLPHVMFRTNEEEEMLKELNKDDSRK